MEDLFESISTHKNPPSTFCSGLAGIGWLVEFVKRKNIVNINTGLVLEDVDYYIFKEIERHLLMKHWDFLHGAIGYGIYFLSSLYRSKYSLQALEHLLSFLERNAEYGYNDTIRWKSIIDIKRDTYRYSISLSHGISSIVMFLVKLSEHNLFKDRSMRLLKGSVKYIMQQEMDPERDGSYFPSFSLDTEKKTQKSRLAWCHGDLGVSLALWRAGRYMNLKEVENKAMEVLLYAAEKRKNLEDNSVFDAGICHGSSGIALIFELMWRNTHNVNFKNATEYWIKETIAMSKFEEGLAGYKSWHPNAHGQWVNEYDLLDGISGIGLVLHTHLHGADLNWSECLMLS